ncbi:DUF1822 family protein [Anabaena sp. CCY 9402-a]|uniref:DUF1822 family protein n=1 Tax=Anabaena sp. CCY 9402-a TaxID=3103867 RepID=UPI0039C69FB9
MEVLLEISATTQDKAWKQSQCLSSPSTRFQAYINRLALLTVLPWLEAAWEVTAKPLFNLNALNSIWEFTNGTAINVDQTRIVLIPSQAIDTQEIRVPQEWVDIPSWVADYYVAVQVNIEDGWVKIWGYTTHLELKQQGNYNGGYRTYSLDIENLTRDINLLWITKELCPDVVTKTEIEPLTSLPLTQANNLLVRLGNPALAFPRRAVPFSLWGALLEHGGWRQRLYELRLGLPEQWSIIQWAQTGISDLAQEVGWSYLDLKSSFVSRGTTPKSERGVLCRQLTIAGELYELQVKLQGEITAGIWRIELRSLSLNGLIPRGFKLRLFTEDLQSFADNERIATEATQKLEFELLFEPGEGLVWEIEPHPDNYDREILRF